MQVRIFATFPRSNEITGGTLVPRSFMTVTQASHANTNSCYLSQKQRDHGRDARATFFHDSYSSKSCKYEFLLPFPEAKRSRAGRPCHIHGMLYCPAYNHAHD